MSKSTCLQSVMMSSSACRLQRAGTERFLRPSQFLAGAAAVWPAPPASFHYHHPHHLQQLQGHLHHQHHSTPLQQHHQQTRQARTTSCRHDWPQGSSIPPPVLCINTSGGILHCRTLHTGLQAGSSRWGHLTSVEDAHKYLASMPVPQRLCLEKAVLEGAKLAELAQDVTPPTWRQLKLLCYHHALPFVGFGFLDNFIMITVGEYIDFTVGAALSISTMAAAGIGNLISDLAGLGLADRVEYLCKLLGLPDPKLSPAQLQHKSSRLIGLLGRCLGITIGCTIGMAPLLWFDSPEPPPDD